MAKQWSVASFQEDLILANRSISSPSGNHGTELPGMFCAFLLTLIYGKNGILNVFRYAGTITRQDFIYATAELPPEMAVDVFSAISLLRRHCLATAAMDNGTDGNFGE